MSKSETMTPNNALQTAGSRLAIERPGSPSLTHMDTRSRKDFPVRLLFMWGVMGAMVACCLLWVLLSVGGEPVSAFLQLSRRVLASFSVSFSPFAEFAVLHLQFAGLGFLFGSGFRLLGWRRQFGNRHDNAA